jgi:hypothetical protein
VKERNVHVRRGETAHVHVGKKLIHVTRFASGAIEVRLESSVAGVRGKVLASWAPKDARVP